MSDKVAESPNGNRVSGAINCNDDGDDATDGGNGNVPVIPTPLNRCQTISGGTVGVDCVIPWNYQGKQYSGCTIADASDGKLWCSVRVDPNGNHIGGKGLWGHCNQNCKTDLGRYLRLKKMAQSARARQALLRSTSGGSKLRRAFVFVFQKELQ